MANFISNHFYKSSSERAFKNTPLLKTKRLTKLIVLTDAVLGTLAMKLIYPKYGCMLDFFSFLTV